MAKCILMSIKPKYVSMILNKAKTIEVRKRFPSDYVGWVYIYCCAEDKNGYLIRNRSTKKMEYTYNGFVASVCWLANRKVVARFWCDKVEEINKITMYCRPYNLFETETLQPSELLKQSCLTAEEMTEYFRFYNLPKESAAIHITKLEIFDKPKEISEFKVEHCSKRTCHLCEWHGDYGCISKYHKLSRAPQSYMFIEVGL